MNAGKSTVLLQSAYNYAERGMHTLLFSPAIDQQMQGKIHSRIGLEAEAVNFSRDFNFYKAIQIAQQEDSKLRCILIDEAQFLTKAQVLQLTDVVDDLNIPVLTYGLRSDFKGEAFEGSLYLLIWADNLVEIKTICHCGRKATMNIRMDAEGNVLSEGEQVQIGGNESYVSMCRKHFKAAKRHEADN